MARAERNRELKFIQTDLLQSLSSKMKEKVQTKGGEKEEEAEGIELTLGLSLNGRFASDPPAAAGGGGKSMISRSSSISNFMLEKHEMKGLSFETPKEVGLGRTRSLPVETEEERRLRKEQETMRRKEVKRKRMEKNKSLRAVREKESGSGEIVVEPNAIIGGGGGMVTAWGFSSQSSVGSQGSGGSVSSGVSDYEVHLIQGTGKEERSPASAQSPTQETAGKAVKAVEAVVENPPPRVPVADNRVMDAMSSIMSDMPCVSTRVQNGRRVEGFLYKYRNERDLKIVCVCHGSFLSPAEFVKHAGGGDVENPLKHIVVSPAPFM